VSFFFRGSEEASIVLAGSSSFGCETRVVVAGCAAETPLELVEGTDESEGNGADESLKGRSEAKDPSGVSSSRRDCKR